MKIDEQSRSLWKKVGKKDLHENRSTKIDLYGNKSAKQNFIKRNPQNRSISERRSPRVTYVPERVATIILRLEYTFFVSPVYAFSGPQV